MVYKVSTKPNNMNTIGLLGHLIVANKQIHSYQLEALYEYLSAIDINYGDTVLADILDGKESCLSFASALSSYATETTQVKREIYYQLLVLDLVDNSTDKNEASVIGEVFAQSELTDVEEKELREFAALDAATFRKTRNTLFTRNRSMKQQKRNWFQQLVRWVSSLLRRIFRVKKPELPTIEEIEYKSAIERCAAIAGEDFEILSPVLNHILDSCESTINEINTYKNSLSLEIGYSAETANVIRTFVEIIDEKVRKQCEQAQESLNQKRRTVSDFTISLMGRTKAGKSTLHTILTNEGRENIGEGRQRTTRYNRVYQWNLLRLIDTPGIGSAEAGGRSDEEIAESVLGETDIICFVVVDDSILQDVFEFMERIAELNKPIIILINHKENIRHEVKYKRFLTNPREWIETEGEANLGGHFHRIQKYADDHGFGTLIKIYPVFLLPALMSSEKEYAENSDLLWESSNIASFIEQLKTWITVSGTIKRSQTILDEAIQVFKQSTNIISDATATLTEQREKLAQQKTEKISELKETEYVVCQRAKNVLEEKFERLARQDALVFAEEEYGRSGNHAEHWKLYVERIGFEKDVSDALNGELQVYYEKAKDVVSALFEDLYYSAKLSFNAHNINTSSLFDFRTASRIFGGVASTVGAVLLAILGNTNPIGWVVTVVGMILGLGSNLFMTREQRRQRAINKIYDAVSKGLDENAPETIDKIMVEIQNSLSENTKKIDMMFDDLINGLWKTEMMALKLQEEYQKAQDELNRWYAFRLVQFIENQIAAIECTPEDIISVDRTTPGRIVITATGNVKTVENYSLDGVITEKVFIERRSVDE